jgi:acetolactate synthase-1/2/3 large subunit
MKREEWIAKCNHWKSKWAVANEQPKQDSNITFRLNLYDVLTAVNKYSTSDATLMGDAGSISYAGPVALNAKEGQRFVFSPAQADMGWALPASIGVALASKKPVIAIIGDGSFMTNLQELAVVRQHDLNIKFIVLNNNGYLSIKNTQSKYFEGRVYGTSTETGLWFPSFKSIADTFRLGYESLRTQSEIDSRFEKLLSSDGPSIIDCICREDQEILPGQALKNGKQAGLHDMTPFLSDQELSEEMIIKIKE